MDRIQADYLHAQLELKNITKIFMHSCAELFRTTILEHFILCAATLAASNFQVFYWQSFHLLSMQLFCQPFNSMTLIYQSNHVSCASQISGFIYSMSRTLMNTIRWQLIIIIKSTTRLALINQWSMQSSKPTGFLINTQIWINNQIGEMMMQEACAVSVWFWATRIRQHNRCVRTKGSTALPPSHGFNQVLISFMVQRGRGGRTSAKREGGAYKGMGRWPT